jgi:hypothetical protein
MDAEPEEGIDAAPAGAHQDYPEADEDDLTWEETVGEGQAEVDSGGDGGEKAPDGSAEAGRARATDDQVEAGPDERAPNAAAADVAPPEPAGVGDPQDRTGSAPSWPAARREAVLSQNKAAGGPPRDLEQDADTMMPSWLKQF